MSKHRTALAVLVACALTGCGHHASTSHRLSAGGGQSCPANKSYMGCAQPQSGLKLGPTLAPPTGALFPDVSVWQGAVDWNAVAGWQRSHRWKLAAIYKLGEYTLDPQAVRNASETTRLGFWRAGYWFVRNTGCQHEASLIVWAAQRFGVKVVVEDLEVPEARGYGACLTPQLRAAGLIPIEYTSPGTNPDGSAHPVGLGTWGAAFGPFRPCLPWGCSLLAWQFTDGKYGAVVNVPGIGTDDVNVDLGITRLGPVPRLVCFGPHAQNVAQCQKLRAQVAGLLRGAASSQRAHDATARNITRLTALEQLFAARQVRLAALAAQIVKANS